jgi:hypothetical protein
VPKDRTDMMPTFQALGCSTEGRFVQRFDLIVNRSTISCIGPDRPAVRCGKLHRFHPKSTRHSGCVVVDAALFFKHFFPVM